MTKDNDTKLQKLLKKREQLDARIKLMQAREKLQKRKDDTRRKIIIGAIAKKHMEMHQASSFAKELQSLLGVYVTKERDRKLLGMGEVTKELTIQA